MIGKWGYRILVPVLCLCGFLAASLGAAAEEKTVYPPETYAFQGAKVVRTYESETLKITVTRFYLDDETCYLSKIWVQDPARQIRKVTAEWRKNIKLPRYMAEDIPEAALIINGSGYVSPTYPWIPENYPGTNEDYYYTPLGSLTVTDGELFRDLEGVPYYGLALDEDGLQMYVDADNETVKATNPVQTWSFYVECPMIRDNQDILPASWQFADRKARRTVIGRVNRNNYLILNVTSDGGSGLTLRRVSKFFLKHFNTEWVYNLDGGKSIALLSRKRDKKRPISVVWGGASIVDIMAFTE